VKENSVRVCQRDVCSVAAASSKCGESPRASSSSAPATSGNVTARSPQNKPRIGGLMATSDHHDINSSC
jgi:hypothetical protein